MTLKHCISIKLICLAALFSAHSAYGAANSFWAPVTDAEKAMKSPVVDPEAGAEALFWRVYVQDEFQGEDPRTVLNHYVRVKVFNDRGRDALKTIDIQYGGRNSVLDLSGRTIKADGTIVELRKDAILERDVVKASGVKVKAKSFAMPAVEPGAIVEYRWREVRDLQLANYIRLQLQREIPTQVVEYHIKPLQGARDAGYHMRTLMFNAPPSPMTLDREQYSVLTMRNVPAFKEEPAMPPEAMVRPWVLVYYANQDKTAEKFWPEYGKKVFDESRRAMKVTAEIQAAAKAAIEDATDPEEKVKRLFRYCRTQIKYLYDDDVTEEQRRKAKDNKTAADTLKQRIGTSNDINLLFAAMAQAVPLETRVARLAARGDAPFSVKFPDDYFLNARDIAVKINGGWKFYDVSQRNLPFGMLDWREEGAPALICEEKNAAFVQVPMPDWEKSAYKRKATLTLGEDGTLEGDVTLQYTGHVAAGKRPGMKEKSEAQREEAIKENVRGYFSNAEVSAIRIENLKDPDQPLVYSYHVKVPGYGRKTGKRIFFQPGFFQYGVAARFTASQRKYDVHFDYPINESDQITFKLPDGYALENAQAPEVLNFGKPGGYEVKMSVKGNVLSFERNFGLFKDGLLVLPVQYYAALKQAFDAVHAQDENTLTLRQQAPKAAQ